MGTVRSGIGSVFVISIMASAAHADPPAQQELAKRAFEVLKTNCYRCHGQDGANEGGFNYVLDRRQLVSRRKVVPAEPAKSKILRRILNTVDPMPPAEEKVRPRPDDIALLKKWIEAGAPEIEVVAKQSFLSPEYVLQTMRNDLERLPERDRRFIR